MLSKYFTRIAFGGLVTAWFGLTGYMFTSDTLFPPDDNSITTAQANDNRSYQKTFRTRWNYSPTARRRLSIYNLAHCGEEIDQNKALVSNDNLTPEDFREKFDAAGGNASKQLCVWAAFDPFATPYKKRDLFKKAYTLNNEAFATMDYFQREFNPAQKYKDWEAARLEIARKEISSHPAIIKAYKEWLPQSSYKNKRQAFEQHRLKRDALRLVSDIIRKSFGLKPIPLYLSKFPMMGNFILGAYSPMEDVIKINYRPGAGTTNSFESALATTIEEAKHSVDSAFALLLEQGKMDHIDIRAAHAAAILLNSKQLANSFTKSRYDDADLWTILTSYGFDPAFEAYKQQYIERNAKEFKATLRSQIMQDIKCGAEGDAVSCVIQKGFDLF